MTCKKKIINHAHDLLKRARDYNVVPSICYRAHNFLIRSLEDQMCAR